MSRNKVLVSRGSAVPKDMHLTDQCMGGEHQQEKGADNQSTRATTARREYADCLHRFEWSVPGKYLGLRHLSECQVEVSVLSA